MEALRRCNGFFPVNLLTLLVLGLIAVSASQADDAVIYVDSSVKPGHFRVTPPVEEKAFSYDDIVTSFAVLLGVVPKVAVDEKVASKIDSVVSPNPFHRPRAVLSVNIGGFECDTISNEATLGLLGLESFQLRSLMTEDAPLRQTFGDDVNVEILKNWDTAYIDSMVHEQELEFVFMSSSYDLNEDTKTVTSISWDISSIESFSLDLSKSVERLFLKELIGLFRNMKRAVSSQESVDPQRPAGLFFGTFNGVSELRKHYGSGPQIELASKFVLHAMNQALQFLQQNYNDELVGVFTLTKSANDFEITASERRSRFLEAVAPAAGNETSPENLALRLGNQAVVFFTVLILLVTLLLSTCCMFTMPLTRDSLLYSGLKLD